MQAAKGITIGAAQTTSTDTLNERASKKVRVNQVDASATTHVLSDIRAGGNIGIATPGALTVAGATIAADGLLAINAGSVKVTGVIDEVTQDTKRVVKSGGLLSSKKTTRVSGLVDQNVVGSTLEGDQVAINSLGAVSILGSNVVATRDVAIKAGGAIDIGTMVEDDSSSNSVKVKKSGLSLSGGGLFVGVSKNRNDTTLATSTNVGSLIGSGTGNVTLKAGAFDDSNSAGGTRPALTITGSDVVAPGKVNLIGGSVTIANATDTATSTSLSKSSNFGVTVKAQSNVVDAIKTVASTANIAANTSSARVAAVGAVASGLAVKNGVDAAEGIAKTIKEGKGSLGVTVSASLGFSKSKSTSEGTDQTVVASNISGGSVNILATGEGAKGTVRVTGSDVTAAKNLNILASGPITFEAAQETDTTSGKSSSFGVSLGVSAGVGLKNGKLDTGAPSVNFGASGSKSSFSGTDVTNRETVVSAGGTATVGTPGALVLDGAVLSGNRVEVGAGSLSIASRQDLSTFQSKEKSAGLNVSVTMSGQVSASGNFSAGKQSGDFASVAEQAGIVAGDGGFDINVTGETSLKGAVIASEAAPDLNRLVTGTLSASDITNTEKYKATSISMGAGIGANLGQDREGDINTNGSGKPLPGIATPIGTISATVPVALGASGSQSSTTHSAIAPAAIVISSGDAASQQAAVTISRDTANANEALEKEFTAEKRDEIQQGFTVVKQLVVEVSTYFANRASDQKEKEDEAAKKEEEARTGTRVGEDDKPIQLTDVERQQARDDAHKLRTEAHDLKTNFGPGSPIRLIATALTGAAGGNVTGSVGSFVQSAAVNVLQGLAVQEVKTLVDGIGDAATRETTRGALQALVACAGATAGSGDCGSAALGAAASVALNNVINALVEEQGDANKDAIIDPLSAQESKARVDLVTTIVAGIAAGVGLDPGSAATAAQLEIENNGCAGGVCYVNAKEGLTQAQFRQKPEYRLMLAALGSDSAVFACIAQSGSTSCGTGSERSDTLKAALDDYYGNDAQGKDKALNDVIAGRTTIEDVARASSESAALGRGFGEAATQGRQTALQDIYNKGPVSAEMASVLQMANQLGLSAAELRSLASLPGSQIASEISPAMRRAAMQAVKNPVGLAAAAATIGGLIIYAENNPISSPTTPAPQQPVLPGFTPADGKDITPPLTGLPAIDLSGPLVGTFPIADPLPPIIATPLPGPITPPNTGFGDGAEVPNGSVLLNDGSTGTSGPSFLPGRSDGGPGEWIVAPPLKNPQDTCYQCQITGAPPQIEYKVNGIRFDGYVPSTNVLIDAKRWEKWPLPDKGFSQDSVMQTADSQIRAARGTGATIEWHVPNQAAKDKIEKIFTDKLGSLPEITIKITPKG
jgi:filamentous hemagglutinin